MPNWQNTVISSGTRKQVWRTLEEFILEALLLNLRYGEQGENQRHWSKTQYLEKEPGWCVMQTKGEVSGQNCQTLRICQG